MINVCDGCRVAGVFEHRCHGEEAVVSGKKTGKPCECKECAPVSLDSLLFVCGEYSADSRRMEWEIYSCNKPAEALIHKKDRSWVWKGVSGQVGQALIDLSGNITLVSVVDINNSDHLADLFDAISKIGKLSR